MPAGTRIHRGDRAARGRSAQSTHSTGQRLPTRPHRVLVDHLHAVAPWGVQVTVELEAEGAPFRAAVDGPAYEAMSSAMEDAFGTPMTTPGARRIDPALQCVRRDLP